MKKYIYQIAAPLLLLIANVFRDYLVIINGDLTKFFIFFSIINIVTLPSASFYTMVHTERISIKAHAFIVAASLFIAIILSVFYFREIYYLFLLAVTTNILFSYISNKLISIGFFILARYHHFIHIFIFLALWYMFFDEDNVLHLYVFSLIIGFIIYLALYLFLNCKFCRVNEGVISKVSINLNIIIIVVFFSSLGSITNNLLQFFYFSDVLYSGFESRISFYLVSLFTVPIGYLVYKDKPPLFSLFNLLILVVLSFLVIFVLLYLELSPLYVFPFVVFLSYAGRNGVSFIQEKKNV
ncbi:hypothetical protein XMD420_000118 [Marinobacterium sp. xm-d-420]|uniref:hypothetical protein n=1 Tax=Marinobacterium sp. xm-d-420 TaxID=2497737 RepID=UPI001569302B|nr:hypothetical protein [Marinobacterium sp. xm-d-420]NRP26535.1 hypothetical protein [Marinobacterium sp. xm-d-420]